MAEPPKVTSSAHQEEITGDMNQIPLRRSPTFVSIYANNVNFVTTPWDFELLFGQTVPEDPSNIHIAVQAMVTVSPQMAKALATSLIQNVRAYEQQFGEIRYTPLPQGTEEPSA
jgi:hypothetical protein